MIKKFISTKYFKLSLMCMVFAIIYFTLSTLSTLSFFTSCRIFYDIAWIFAFVQFVLLSKCIVEVCKDPKSPKPPTVK